MRGGCSRFLVMALLGAGGGAVAALAGYSLRSTDRRDIMEMVRSVQLDELLLSTQKWSIVGLCLLGVLVCGTLAAASVRSTRPLARLRAFLIAAPLGALMCWGARWLMDVFVRSAAGGAKSLDAIEAATITTGPWFIWQAAIGFGITVPIVLAIGVNRFTVMRGLIGAGMVIVGSFFISSAVGAVVVGFALAMALGSGGASSGGLDFAQITDVSYLFSMGLAAGIAFAVAEAVYKPAWLKSLGGRTEGRTWTIRNPVARIGSMEGIEVFIPPDGTVAPVHAQIQAQDDAHFVTDLVGGTLLNGTPAQAQWLRDGDVLTIGSALLVYRTRLDGKPAEPVRASPIELAPVAPVSALAVELLDELGNRLPLRLGSNSVGRNQSCDIALTWEPSVSRQHAEIVLRPDGGLTVRDLGSTNGTFLDGAPIAGEPPFVPGQVVRFGKASFRLAEQSKPVSR